MKKNGNASAGKKGASGSAQTAGLLPKKPVKKNKPKPKTQG